MELRIKRLLSQVLFFSIANLGAFKFKTGFCVPFFYCHSCPTSAGACPIKSLESGVFKGNLDWKLIFFPLMIIGFVGILFGRAVCGWACPIGLLQRATGRVPRLIKKRYPHLKKLSNSKIDRYMRYSKYLVLIFLVFITTYFIGFMFTDICPVGILVGTFPTMILNPGAYTPNVFFLAAMIVFLLFIILIFTVERGWCRYFCPVGALFAPFNKVSIYHVYVDKEKCIHCNKCIDVCPMGIDVPNMNRSPECILCGKCIQACPENIISFRRN